MESEWCARRIRMPEPVRDTVYFCVGAAPSGGLRKVSDGPFTSLRSTAWWACTLFTASLARRRTVGS